MDLAREAAPDATTLLRFRRLLEAHHLTRAIFEAINRHFADRGLLMRKGTVVDAWIISAPSSTKNRERARDPEMHQTKKGKQWYHGLKAHIGSDADSGITHTLVTTAANTADINVAHALLHGTE
jgi:IS5 family transposase